ncbi:MAG: glycosyltransferase, partial [Thalassobaculaceae bacterium]
GGSQGARVFADILPPALAALPAPLRARLRVAQQARQEDVARVTAAYRESGIAAEVTGFFADMAHRLAAAHLLICRAGASTMAEIAAAGRPAVLVPYPHAMDEHQTANARAAGDIGAAWLLAERTLTVDDLRACLEHVLGNPACLPAAAAAARRLDHPGAAEALADLLPINGREARP